MLFSAIAGRLAAADQPPTPGPGDSQTVQVTGIVQTGLVAIGGETTGTAITADGKTYELDFRKRSKLHAKAEILN